MIINFSIETLNLSFSFELFFFILTDLFTLLICLFLYFKFLLYLKNLDSTIKTFLRIEIIKNRLRLSKYQIFLKFQNIKVEKNIIIFLI